MDDEQLSASQENCHRATEGLQPWTGHKVVGGLRRHVGDGTPMPLDTDKIETLPLQTPKLMDDKKAG